MHRDEDGANVTPIVVACLREVKMTDVRFEYQREKVMNTTGTVLNIGANEDPAQLKSIAPDRVINCDLTEHDLVMDRPNEVDIIFDARDTWPFEDNSAELVVLGDILEHLYDEEIVRVFCEARRVAERACITVPKDPRFQQDGVGVDAAGGRSHCNLIDRERLITMLEYTGWFVREIQIVDYHFVPEGYFVEAVRADV